MGASCAKAGSWNRRAGWRSRWEAPCTDNRACKHKESMSTSSALVAVSVSAFGSSTPAAPKPTSTSTTNSASTLCHVLLPFMIIQAFGCRLNATAKRVLLGFCGTHFGILIDRVTLNNFFKLYPAFCRENFKPTSIHPKQSKAKQSKAKQSKTKQSKAKQSKAKQSKAKQSKAKQSKAKQNKTKQSKRERQASDWRWMRTWWTWRR